MGSIAIHETIFPLDDHPKVLVVQQQHFHGKLFTEAGCQFLDVHLETAVAVDIDDQRIGIGCLNSHRCRQSEAHRAQSAAAEPRSGTTELVELGGPHLMLADANGDVGIHVGRDVAERLDGMLLQDAVKVVVVLQRVFRFQLFAVFLPIRDVGLLNDLVQLGQHLFDVTANRNVRGLVLVQLRRIDVDMNDLCILWRRIQLCQSRDRRNERPVRSTGHSRVRHSWHTRRHAFPTNPSNARARAESLRSPSPWSLLGYRSS